MSPRTGHTRHGQPQAPQLRAWVCLGSSRPRPGQTQGDRQLGPAPVWPHLPCTSGGLWAAGSDELWPTSQPPKCQKVWEAAPPTPHWGLRAASWGAFLAVPTFPACSARGCFCLCTRASAVPPGLLVGAPSAVSILHQAELSPKWSLAHQPWRKRARLLSMLAGCEDEPCKTHQQQVDKRVSENKRQEERTQAPSSLTLNHSIKSLAVSVSIPVYHSRPPVHTPSCTSRGAHLCFRVVAS